MISCKIIFPVNKIILNKLNISFTAVYYKTGPVVIYKQKSCVGLSIVLNTKFDKNLIRNFYLAYYVLNDAILAPLRKNLEFYFRETIYIFLFFIIICL